MVKKGFLKKTGCILISASMILAGWTFMGSSVSEAELDTEVVQQATGDGLAPAEDSNTITGELATEESTVENQSEEQVDTETEVPQEEAVPEETAESAEETQAPSLKTKLLNAISPTLLTTSLTATSSSSEATYEGNTLVSVPNTVTSFTVPSSYNGNTITKIAAGAFTSSNVSSLTFENGKNITDIGDQGGWPATGSDIYCPDCVSTDYVVKYFLNLDRDINVYFYDEPVTEEHSITIEYILLDSEGNTVAGSPYTASTFYVDDGVTPSFDYPETYIKNGIVYYYKLGPSPDFVEATADAVYTYTYQSKNDTPTEYAITINYALQNASGTVEKTVIAKTLSVNAGEKPSYTPGSTYTDGDTTYGLISGPSPAFVEATADAEYTYTYKAGATPVTQHNITINYALQDSAGKAVKTVTGSTFTVSEGSTPSYSAPSTYVDGGTTYGFVSGPNPAFAPATADATYTYTYRVGVTPTPTDGYTITITYVLQGANGNTVTTVTDSTFKVAAGVTPTYTRKEYTVYNGTIYYYMTGPDKGFAPATADATYTYVYKVNTGKKRYSVTVKDQFYSYDKSRHISTSTRTTDNYDEGSSYSYGPISVSGYEYFDAERQSGTVTADRTVVFKYKEVSPGSGRVTPGTTQGGGDAYASTAAQTNQKYKIIQGASQTVAQDAGAVTITCDGTVDKFLYILFDGKVLASTNYTIKSGSTILTLTREFVNTLSVGDHVVQFQYNDGYAMTGMKVAAAGTKTTTTVTYKVAADGSISAGHTKDATPKTADGFDSRYLLCIAIFLLGAGAIMMGKQRRLEALLADRDEE